VILFLILSFARCELRLHEFLANLAVASLLTAVGMTLIPAEGAYAFYRPAASAFSGYSVDAGMWHHAVLTELRTGAAPVLDFAGAQGLVTFPSFHTALAIITWYAVRDWRFLSPLFATLCILVIIATLPEGGHHFVDLVAGGAIAGLAILLVDRASALSATSPSDRRKMSLKARRT
jgi:membrane-associated phospholipid phosphatase